jgi:hypothetical protein
MHAIDKYEKNRIYNDDVFIKKPKKSFDQLFFEMILSGTT